MKTNSIHANKLQISSASTHVGDLSPESNGDYKTIIDGLACLLHHTERSKFQDYTNFINSVKAQLINPEIADRELVVLQCLAQIIPQFEIVTDSDVSTIIDDIEEELNIIESVTDEVNNCSEVMDDPVTA